MCIENRREVKKMLTYDKFRDCYALWVDEFRIVTIEIADGSFINFEVPISRDWYSSYDEYLEAIWSYIHNINPSPPEGK